MKNDSTFAHLGMKDMVDNMEDDNSFSLNEYYAFFFLQRSPKEMINPLYWSVFAYLSLLVLKEHWMMKYLMIDCVSSQYVARWTNTPEKLNCTAEHLLHLRSD